MVLLSSLVQDYDHFVERWDCVVSPTSLKKAPASVSTQTLLGEVQNEGAKGRYTRVTDSHMVPEKMPLSQEVVYISAVPTLMLKCNRRPLCIMFLFRAWGPFGKDCAACQSGSVSTIINDSEAVRGN